MDDQNRYKIKFRKKISAKKFEQWKIDSLQLSSVISREDHKDIFELTKAFLEKSELKPLNCYVTATECTANCKDVQFVLGYATRYFPKFRHVTVVDHAWNSFNSTEFDLMKKFKVGYQNYFKIIELPMLELLNYLFTNEYLMDHTILKFYYTRFVAKEEDLVLGIEPCAKAVQTVIQEIVQKYGDENGILRKLSKEWLSPK